MLRKAKFDLVWRGETESYVEKPSLTREVTNNHSDKFFVCQEAKLFIPLPPIDTLMICIIRVI